MEKLQAALEKARKSRGSKPASGPARPQAPQASPRSTGAQDLWAALPELALDDAALAHHLVVSRAASDKATPFDILRTKILLQMQQNGWSRLAITSAMPKSGKTTMACNLALGLGRQSNLSAMLFDLDLRDPSVHAFFDYAPPHSVAQVLTGQVPFAEQAVRIGDNVAVSASALPETDPTRILLAEQTAETLDEIQSAYTPDVMIFDLPSLLVGDNTRAFLKNVDCALIIARAGATRFGQFDTCEREIAEHTNVLGVVLNAYRYGASHNDTD